MWDEHNRRLVIYIDGRVYQVKHGEKATMLPLSSKVVACFGSINVPVDIFHIKPEETDTRKALKAVLDAELVEVIKSTIEEFSGAAAKGVGAIVTLAIALSDYDIYLAREDAKAIQTYFESGKADDAIEELLPYYEIALVSFKKLYIAERKADGQSTRQIPSTAELTFHSSTTYPPNPREPVLKLPIYGRPECFASK
jgi:hypothetical protein